MSCTAPSLTRPNGPDPLPDRPAAATAPSRSAGLLGLVRNLIAFGQALLQTLQAAPAAATLSHVIARFGTSDLALIVARITRGLMLAAHLDARLVRCAARLDTPPAPSAARRGADRHKRRSPGPVDTQTPDDAALLARLPTAQEIAASVRGKPIGIVLEEICRDLGITSAHPLWRDLQTAIIAHGGRLDRMFDGIHRRLHAGYFLMPEAVSATMPHPPLAATALRPTGTGPP